MYATTLLVLVGVVYASQIPGLLRQDSLQPAKSKLAIVAQPLNKITHLLRSINDNPCPSGNSPCAFDMTSCCPIGCTVQCPGSTFTCCPTGLCSIYPFVFHTPFPMILTEKLPLGQYCSSGNSCCPSGEEVCTFDATKCCPPGCTISCGNGCCSAGQCSICLFQCQHFTETAFR